MSKKPDLWEVFARLFAAYGPQGWWPVTMAAGSPPVYRPGRYVPDSDEEVFEVAVGAILTQNTSWENVKKALVRLTGAGVRSPHDILALSEVHLAELIRSSGYFRQKARRLRTLAEHRGGCVWEAQETGALRALLLGLTGVGPETADSILLYALGRPVFVVDAYTRRLVHRLGLFPAAPSYDAVQRYVEERLTPSVPLYNEYHALIVALGKVQCAARPHCPGCPLLALCPTGRLEPPRRGAMNS